MEALRRSPELDGNQRKRGVFSVFEVPKSVAKSGTGQALSRAITEDKETRYCGRKKSQSMHNESVLMLIHTRSDT